MTHLVPTGKCVFRSGKHAVPTNAFNMAGVFRCINATSKSYELDHPVYFGCKRMSVTGIFCSTVEFLLKLCSPVEKRGRNCWDMFKIYQERGLFPWNSRVVNQREWGKTAVKIEFQRWCRDMLGAVQKLRNAIVGHFSPLPYVTKSNVSVLPPSPVICKES